MNQNHAVRKFVEKVSFTISKKIGIGTAVRLATASETTITPKLSVSVVRIMFLSEHALDCRRERILALQRPKWRNFRYQTRGGEGRKRTRITKDDLTDIFQDLENQQKFLNPGQWFWQLVATPLLGPVEIWVKIQLLLALPSSSSV